MQTYNEFCPYCKKLNADLNLEETHGLYECIGCGKVVEVEKIKKREPWLPQKLGAGLAAVKMSAKL